MPHRRAAGQTLPKTVEIDWKTGISEVAVFSQRDQHSKSLKSGFERQKDLLLQAKLPRAAIDRTKSYRQVAARFIIVIKVTLQIGLKEHQIKKVNQKDPLNFQR